MSTEPQTGLTYADLRAFPEDTLRRELIDGELVVTAAPATRHQEVVLRLGASLLAYTDQQGGKVYIAPTDVCFTDSTVLEPDVLFLTAERVDRAEEQFIRGAPDIVVEVSSPSTRRLELVRKLEVYRRFVVREHWYVDLDADRVEMYELREGAYAEPRPIGREGTLASGLLPGFSMAVGELLPPPGGG